MADVKSRREDILTASAELFAKKGVASTSMREVADLVGVQPGALYHHFPSKDAIVNELITRFLVDLQTAYDAGASPRLDPRERLGRIVELSLEAAQAQPHSTQVFQNELASLRERPEYACAKDLADRVQQTWLDAITAGQGAGAFRSDVPAKVFHRFLRDAVWLSVRWHRNDDLYTNKELAHDCLSVFLEGFALPPRTRLSSSRQVS